MEQELKMKFIKAAFDLLYFENNEKPSPYDVTVRNVNQIHIGEYFYISAHELAKMTCNDIINDMFDLMNDGRVDEAQDEVDEAENRLYWEGIEQTENFLNYDITKHIK